MWEVDYMNRLKELRLAHGFKSQKDLAEVLFVNQTAVSQWERGATMPSSQMLVKLSKMYGVSVDYLLGQDEEKPPVKDRGLSEKDVRLIEWFRALPPEKQKAILIAQDGPEDLSD